MDIFWINIIKLTTTSLVISQEVYFIYSEFFLMVLCFQFIMTAVSVALPIPAGVFFPVFLIGEENFEITNKIIIISRSVDCVCF